MYKTGNQRLPQRKCIPTTKCFKMCLYTTIFGKFCHLAYILVHSRTLNHRLPTQRRQIQNVPFEERICTEYNSEDIDDELHYIFQCSFFRESSQKFLPELYCRNANAFKFNTLFCSKKKRLLINLANFVKVVMNEF